MKQIPSFILQNISYCILQIIAVFAKIMNIFEI
jgi:hypothetical protein